MGGLIAGVESIGYLIAAEPVRNPRLPDTSHP